MIEYLHIRDLAIIDELEVDFRPGFNVITGETGAGKSILVQALSLLRGVRTKGKLVRKGRTTALIEAVIVPPAQDDLVASLLNEVDMEAVDQIVVSRILSTSGHGRVRINGELTTVRVLAKLVGALVDVTGQREQQSLAELSNHRILLDRFGVPIEVVAEYRKAYNAYRALCRKIDETPSDAQRLARIDVLRHLVDELAAVGLKADEEDELEDERRRLSSVLDMKAAVAEAVEAVYEGAEAAVDRLSQAERGLLRWNEVDPEMGEYVSRLSASRALLEDVARDMVAKRDRLEPDPVRLDEVEQRLMFLADLKRKHRCRFVSDLVVRQRELERELVFLEGAASALEDLEEKIDGARHNLERAGAQLERRRRESASRIEALVGSHLREVGMEGAEFKVAMDPSVPRDDDDERFVFDAGRAGPFGWNRIRFLVKTNPGEDLRPVDEVASGGELSRILLAVKTAVVGQDPVAFYVFDEVDQGVGGKIADVVGGKLFDLSRYRQVLCVTHLPQIAAYADHHYVVTKTTKKGRATSSIVHLDDDARIEELARMNGTVTNAALDHARSMIERARRKRR